MAKIKSDVDLETLKPLSEAEQDLIECCKAGQPFDLGNTVPDQAPAGKIRLYHGC
ncbi:MAG: hypothetical protein JKX71_12765 [Amylibacter sp.]|nr:hypothetical protein [Amylibacter sp.]